MEKQDARKLIKLGQGRGSLAVTIPLEWVEKKGLKPGDIVIVYTNDDVTLKPLQEGR